LIYFFKGMGKIAERLLDTLPKEFGIPSIVVYELEVGIAKSISPEKRTAQLADLLSLVDVLPFGLPEAGSAAQIRVALEKRGQPISPYDTLMAAIALANQAVLITHNTKAFEKIGELQIEDWFS
jgi:tRNA(fMet)-specific endonuclease VapC